jgi:KDO2-lipid IV(A) lauroyltransferase
MIAYLLFRFVAFFFWLMPFWLLYRLSDLLYWVFYGLGYRYKVVMSNLERVFPQYSLEKRQQIAKDFYRHFADIVVEGLKGIYLSKEQAMKRYHIPNPDGPSETFYQQGKSAIFVGAHYGNWEWGALGVAGQVKPTCVVIFKPIKNRYIHEYIIRSRSKYGTRMVSAKDTRMIFKELEEEKHEPALYFLLADQHPSNKEEAHWVDFFGAKTPFLHGPAKYAKKYNLPVCFIHQKRLRRGYYQTTGEYLIDDTSQLSAEEITQRFAQRLQAMIEENPSIWLWSHKRWK